MSQGQYGVNRKRIIELLKAGASYTVIAREVGVTNTRIGTLYKDALKKGDITKSERELGQKNYKLLSEI